MLRLNEASLGARVTSDDVTRASRASGELLAQVQKGEVCYRGSLGWLHVDEWASVEQLVRIAELASRLRAETDTFVLIGVGGSTTRPVPFCAPWDSQIPPTRLSGRVTPSPLARLTRCSQASRATRR